MSGGDQELSNDLASKDNAEEHEMQGSKHKATCPFIIVSTHASFMTSEWDRDPDAHPHTSPLDEEAPDHAGHLNMTSDNDEPETPVVPHNQTVNLMQAQRRRLKRRNNSFDLESSERTWHSADLSRVSIRCKLLSRLPVKQRPWCDVDLDSVGAGRCSTHSAPAPLDLQSHEDQDHAQSPPLLLETIFARPRTRTTLGDYACACSADDDEDNVSAVGPRSSAGSFSNSLYMNSYSPPDKNAVPHPRTRARSFDASHHLQMLPLEPRRGSFSAQILHRVSLPVQNISAPPSKVPLSLPISPVTDSEKPSVSPLPLRIMFALAFIVISDLMSNFIISPFLPDLVNHVLGLRNDEYAETGIQVATLTTLYCVAQAISNVFIGKLADKVGRRIVLSAGLLGNIVSILLIGVTDKWSIVLLSRVLGGLFNGNLGVVKAIIGEVTDSTNQSAAYALYSFFYGIGLILSQSVGGVLAKPAEKYPTVFGHIQLFHRLPFFLPCFLGAFCCLVGLVNVIFVLPETRPAKLQQKLSEQVEMIAVKKSASLNDEIPTRVYRSVWNRIVTVFKSLPKASYIPLVLYCMLSAQTNAFDDVFSQWLRRPVDRGGLEFDTTSIGVSLSAVNVVSLLSLLFFYPFAQRRFGALFLMRFGWCVFIPVFILFPFQPLLVQRGNGPAKEQIGVWVALMVLLSLRILANQMAFMSIVLLLTNSASAGILGLVHGVSQSMASVVKAVSPQLFGRVWAWSVQPQYIGAAWPSNQSLVFHLLALWALISFCLSLLTRRK